MVVHFIARLRFTCQTKGSFVFFAVDVYDFRVGRNFLVLFIFMFPFKLFFWLIFIGFDESGRCLRIFVNFDHLPGLLILDKASFNLLSEKILESVGMFTN